MILLSLPLLRNSFPLRAQAHIRTFTQYIYIKSSILRKGITASSRNRLFADSAEVAERRMDPSYGHVCRRNRPYLTTLRTCPHLNRHPYSRTRRDEIRPPFLFIRPRHRRIPVSLDRMEPEALQDCTHHRPHLLQRETLSHAVHRSRGERDVCVFVVHETLCA